MMMVWMNRGLESCAALPTLGGRGFRRWGFFLWLGAIICLAAPAFGAARQSSSSESPALASRAMRLLNAHCLSCHNEEKQKSGLVLTTRAAALKGGDNGPAFVSGHPEKSAMFQALAADADPHMPPKKQLSATQIELVRRWIADGAAWDADSLAKASAPRDVQFEAMHQTFKPVFALALSPDATRLAAGRGNRIVIYDLTATNFPILAERVAHRDVVRALAWHPSGNELASGGFREITMWSPATLEAIWSASSNLLGGISALRFTPDGNRLIAGDGVAAESGWVRVFAADGSKVFASWQAHKDTIFDLAISRDGKQLASAGADKVVKVWELASGQERAQLEGHAAAVLGVAFNTNANQLVSVSSDKQLKVWDVPTRESFAGTKTQKRAFTAVHWSADGKTIVAADDDGGLLSFTDIKRHSGAQSSDTLAERKLGNWSNALHSIAVSKERIFAGAHDGTIYALNSSGKLLGKVGPPSDAQTKIAKVQSPSFVRDVLPALSKAGCMAGSCHAKAEGQNGFKLSVFNYDPRGDYAEIVKEARGRRVFPAAPEESLLLLKPTAAVEHGGGERFEHGSETYRLLAAWIRGGMVFQHTNEPVLVRIAVEPHERTYRKRASQPLRVRAHYRDGSTRDVTHLSEFVANDKEIVQVSEEGQLRVGTFSGESVVVTRYMGFVDAAHVTVPAERPLPEKRFAKLPVHNFIDRLAYDQFRRLGMFPSDLCTDAEFVRRSSLDTIGMLPAPDEARQFLADTNTDKRARWIEHLLSHPGYADYWANKWADLLRPNPDRVGVKSVFVLDQWLRESFRANKPYDQFAREILLAEGSNHRDGPAVIYRDRREAADLTTSFSQLFLGTRLECAKCHHHPNEKWSQEDFYEFAAFFGPVKQKGAGLSPPISGGTETFYFVPGGMVKHPVTEEVMKPRPLDGKTLNVSTNIDPRPALVQWLVNPRNPFFAKAAVNRVWASFFGRGFVNPVDDFRVSNPAANEPLLEALADDFAAHRYDFKHLIRTILASRVYQLSSTPNEFNLTDTKNFSRSYRRRLPAEVMLDAVNDVTGVPEDFNGCPPGTRALQTWSYKVRSPLMDAFGRPNSSSDCPCERDLRTSVGQSLHMMNSRPLQSKLAGANGRVKQLAGSKLSPEEIVTELYLAAFSRHPSAEELKSATAAFVVPEATRQTATEDVLWALLNSAEFVFNH
jgi:WD40 repeat protein